VTRDAVVIGGGPAGSTAAALLARQGRRVTVFERERFPREHVGESLLPASLPILEELGALEVLRREGFVEKWGATMVWGTSREPWSWYFRETNPRHPHSYQVWRPRFDQILLERARDAGAEVCEGATVREVIFEGERARGVRVRDASGADLVAEAGFVIDASGQGALLGRRLRLRRFDPFFRNLAVFGWMEGAGRLRAPDQGNIFIESYPGGWLWLIPLQGGRSSVGVVVDASRAGPELRALGVRTFFERAIARTEHGGDLLADARLVLGPRVARDWSYRCTRFAGPGFVLAGDAACFVDPLFSSGVHLALSAGVLAASHVAGVLADPSLEEEAGDAYARLYGTQYEHFLELARLFYAGNRTVESYFWEARRKLGDRDEPRGAFVRAVSGQPPQGYERAVLERSALPPGFRARLGELEQERGARDRELGSRDLRLARPRAAPGVRVERRAMLGEGRFVRGDVLIAPDRVDLPVSALVAELLRLSDGTRSLDEIARTLEKGDVVPARVREPLERAVRILHRDGALDLWPNAERSGS
jgi:flavin-dependent dehydrogenase